MYKKRLYIYIYMYIDRLIVIKANHEQTTVK